MKNKGRVRNGNDPSSGVESNQHVKCDSGVPYENATHDQLLRQIAYLTAEYHSAMTPVLYQLKRRSQKQTRAKASISEQGMGAKFVRPKGKKPG